MQCLVTAWSRAALTLIILQDVWSEASLISHVGGIFSIFSFDDILQVVVDLKTKYLNS